MRLITNRLIPLFGILFLLGTSSPNAGPSLVSYQGQLTDGLGNPLDTTVSITFRIYDAASGGTLLWEEVQTSVVATDGLFDVTLGSVDPVNNGVDETLFGSGNRYLAITVGNDPELSPRTRFVTSPYAHRVTTVDGATGGTIGGDVVVSGEIRSGGKANLGGFNSNTGSAAFVSGQGNTATGNFSSISGGTSNTASGPNSTISGGNGNNASANFSSVGGGFTNFATGLGGTVGGGELNVAEGEYSTSGGGRHNFARGSYSVVGGGGGATPADSNSARGTYSTIPGGRMNLALGSYSFAAGHRAKANHSGVFVWADQTNVDFGSTGMDQFILRASGGVGIGTNSPTEQLEVAGTVYSTSGGFKFPDGTVQTTASAGGGSDGDWTISGNNIFSAVSGNVGVGSASPVSKLHVDGTFKVTGGGPTFDKLTLDYAPGGYSVFQLYDNNTNSDFRFSTNPGDNSWMNGPGNVGIGTTVPSSKLHVSGALTVTGASGDGSVVIPTDAINAAEILDEPGVAQQVHGTGVVALTGPVQNLLSQTINCPTSGFVLVIATCAATASHSGVGITAAEFGVSDVSATFQTIDQRKAWDVTGAMGTYRNVITAQKIFPVSVGPQTFYIVGDLISGSMWVQMMTLSLVFIPSSYGAVVETAAGGGEENSSYR